MVLKPQILLTNDDGIQSPGLWAAAAALSKLGYVHVVAPAQQFSGAGRSLPFSSDGIIRVQEVTVNGQMWKVHEVGGSPAQTVLYAVLEIMPQRPNLVVSGINYGENLGNGITISGTVGAALEAAANGIPALAVSLETGPDTYFSYSEEIDFSTAAHFATYFSRLVLENHLPYDVDVVKVDVPSDATVDTPWEITRVSRISYYQPLPANRSSWDVPGPINYRLIDVSEHEPTDSDVYALRVKRRVSVTPLSLDLTSRVDFSELDHLLRSTSSILE